MTAQQPRKPKTGIVARGRWRGVLKALGVDDSLLTGKQRPCPGCGGKDRFRFDDKEGRGTFYCNQCGAGDGIRLVMMVRGVDFAEAAAAVDEVVGNLSEDEKTDEITPDRVKRTLNGLWTASRYDDAVLRYLASRGIEGIDPGSEVRYHDGLKINPNESHTSPAMVSRVWQAGKPVTLHRTFLAPGIKTRKKLMKGTSKLAKPYIPLMGVPGKIMGIAEGIESALSAAALGFAGPVWASVSADWMERFVPPAGLDELHVFADNDANFVGQAAAYALAREATLKHKVPVVRVHIPDVPGLASCDWNDVLLRSRGSKP